MFRVRLKVRVGGCLRVAVKIRVRVRVMVVLSLG